MTQKLKQDISIGQNLGRLRLRAGYSQEQVAAQMQVMGLSVSREMISQMEQGKYNIRISVLLAMKDLYHASLDEFFTESVDN